MYNYDEEYYFELSEVDDIVNEATEKITEIVFNNVKNNFIEIQKENQKLKKENQKLIDNEQEIKKMKHNLELDRNNLERHIKNKRLSEILEYLKIFLYKVNNEVIKQEKCSLCDDNRKIHFKTPLGKDSFEYCICFKDSHKKVVNEYELFEFRENDDKSISKFYKFNKSSSGDFYSDTTFCRIIIEDNTNFEEIKLNYDTFFRNKEYCQLYCDWLNEKEKV